MQKPTEVKSLFRENAIKRLYSLDEIHSTLKVVQPRAWAWIMSAMFLLASILIWGIFGQISMKIEAVGIVIPDEKFQQTEKLISENLHDRKMKLKTLKMLLDQKRVLYNKHYLTLVELEKAEEDYIAAKNDVITPPKIATSYSNESIFLDQNKKKKDLVALVFVKHIEGKKITIGMKAYILLNGLSAYEYGYLKGKVLTVSTYPASKEIAYAYLGNRDLVDEFFSNGSPFIVKIQLEKNNHSISGFTWTTRKGASFTIEAGSTVTANIIYSVSSPFKLLKKVELS